MVSAIARWIARRLHKQQKLEQALRWYDRSDIKKMTMEEQIQYAELLHDHGKSERAIAILTALLEQKDHPQLFERRAHIYNEIGNKDAAIADLDAAIELDSEPYIYWYTRAISHHDQGEYELSVRDFREALNRREDSKASTYYELGNVYMKQGHYADAEQCYREASSNPAKAIPHYYYRRAQALEQLERTDEALQVLANGIKLLEQWNRYSDRGAALLMARTNYSRAAVANFLNGAQEEYGFRMYESRLLEACGHYEAALGVIDHALLQYDGALELQHRRAALLKLLNRYDEALELMLELKAHHPMWLPAYIELSTIYRSVGQLEEMLHVLQEAVRQFPDDTIVLFWLIDAYREVGHAELALEASAQLTALEPNDPLNWRQRAEILIDADRYSEADEAYTDALQLEVNTDYYMRRSFARYMDGRFEEAMMDIQVAAKLDEQLMEQSKTAYALGELYMGMGNWELADQEYSRALAREPDHSQIYERRARCRLAAGRLTEALEDCNRGLLVDSGNARLIWLRGFVHYRLDDHEAALIDSQTYVELAPEDAQGFYNLGLIYHQLERNDEALAAFTRALELNPFEAQAYLERAGIWYHHFFDRVQASDDLAQWMLYAGGEAPQSDRFALLDDIRGFDDEMRERAKQQFLLVYGSSQYLS